MQGICVNSTAWNFLSGKRKRESKKERERKRESKKERERERRPGRVGQQEGIFKVRLGLVEIATEIKGQRVL